MLQLLFFVIFMIDFGTKALVLHFIGYGEGISLLPIFNIVHVKNLGVSFSFLYNHHTYAPLMFGTFSFVIAVILLNVIRKTKNMRQKFALTAIMSGAVGNMVDRFLYGGVIDFLDFHYRGWHWPAFNIADCSIVAGIFLFVVLDEKK